MGAERYFEHDMLKHFRGKPWVIENPMKKGTGMLAIDLKGGVDPTNGTIKTMRGNKTWGECGTGARKNIALALMEKREAEVKAAEEDWAAKKKAQSRERTRRYRAKKKKEKEEGKKAAGGSVAGKAEEENTGGGSIVSIQLR